MYISDNTHGSLLLKTIFFQNLTSILVHATDASAGLVQFNKIQFNKKGPRCEA